jgi:hypothetical protein
MMKSIAVPITRRSAGSKSSSARAVRPMAPRAVNDDAPEAAGDDAPEASSRAKHRYHIGQRLHLAGGRYWGRIGGACEVIALMPLEAGEFHYRISSEAEHFERIVAEGDLTTKD